MIIFDLIDYPLLCEYAKNIHGEDGIGILDDILLKLESKPDVYSKYSKEHLKNYIKRSIRNKKKTIMVEEFIEPTTNSDNMDLILDIRHKVSLLDTIYKDVIELIMQGYTHKEIAEELGIALKTVYGREKKAKEILKERLKCE